MTGELGQLALCFALALALVMAAAGLAGTRPDAASARRVATSSAMGLLVFVALAFGTLTYAFIVSDFSIMAVANNSHTLKPLIYKISGVWGNHEGSMLLWVLVLALYAALVAGCSAAANGRPAALGVQGLLAAVSSFISLPPTVLSSDPRRLKAQGSIRCCDPGLRCIRPCLCRLCRAVAAFSWRRAGG